MTIENIFENLPKELDGEAFEALAENSCVRIERIISHGHITPEGQWYNQAEDEWVLLLQGAAKIAMDDGREISLQTGEHLWIPAGQKHRVSYTDPQGPTIWLAVHAKA